jgi:2Fe-2S ferredoxin
MKIIVTDQAGETHELEGLDGWRAMEVIRDWGLNIKAECGGSCTCATCHVWVGEGWYDKLPAMQDCEEDLIFSTLDQRKTSRLSCQIILSDALDGLQLTLTPSASKDAVSP